MRMWGVDTGMLCRKHLLGEHVEMHMFIGAMTRKKNLQGFVDKGLVETKEIINRHDQLAAEMIKRGMNHKSPLDSFAQTVLDTYPEQGKLDIEANIEDLINRCADCRALYEARSIT